VSYKCPYVKLNVGVTSEQLESSSLSSIRQSLLDGNWVEFPSFNVADHSSLVTRCPGKRTALFKGSTLISSRPMSAHTCDVIE